MPQFAVHLVYITGKRKGQCHLLPLCTFEANDEEHALEVFDKDHRPEIERKGKEINHFQIKEVEELVDILGD